MAKFKIRNVFEITNRGYAVLGEILDGIIAPGELIQFDLNNYIKIESIESVRSNNLSEIGLMIGTTNNLTISELKKMEGRILLIKE